ncbi:hypothetical protein GCM10023196_035560 [Actinoallomurus vinaceus]|uniref:Secreted protein n=1 Tax=Actinoallomurus vinaceus TaxID=1080074 RepID=A0ABP8U926_9ACTN
MAALTKNVAGPAGLRVDTLFVAASAGGDTAPTGSGVELRVKNGSGSAVTVTIAFPGKYDGDQTVAGRTFSVPATTGEFTIPLRDIYKDPATGLASITYSATTTVTVCVVSVP